MTRRLLAVILVVSAAAPLRAQEPEEGPLLPDSHVFEELAEAMRDAIGRLTEGLQPWGERLGAVLAHPEDYEPPEVLPNGDILIRRKPEAPDREPPAEIDPEQGLDL